VVSYRKFLNIWPILEKLSDLHILIWGIVAFNYFSQNGILSCVTYSLIKTFCIQALDSIASGTKCGQSSLDGVSKYNAIACGRCAINGSVTVKSCRNKLQAKPSGLHCDKKAQRLAARAEFIYLPVGRATHFDICAAECMFVLFRGARSLKMNLLRAQLSLSLSLWNATLAAAAPLL